MLILTRRVRQKLVIGDNVIITVQKLENGKVTLGIEAPKDLPVNRMEVHEAMKQDSSLGRTVTP